MNFVARVHKILLFSYEVATKKMSHNDQNQGLKGMEVFYMQISEKKFGKMRKINKVFKSYVNE